MDCVETYIFQVKKNEFNILKSLSIARDLSRYIKTRYDKCISWQFCVSSGNSDNIFRFFEIPATIFNSSVYKLKIKNSPLKMQ